MTVMTDRLPRRVDVLAAATACALLAGCTADGPGPAGSASVDAEPTETAQQIVAAAIPWPLFCSTGVVALIELEGVDGPWLIVEWPGLLQEIQDGDEGPFSWTVESGDGPSAYLLTQSGAPICSDTSQPETGTRWPAVAGTVSLTVEVEPVTCESPSVDGPSIEGVVTLDGMRFRGEQGSVYAMDDLVVSHGNLATGGQHPCSDDP